MLKKYLCVFCLLIATVLAESFDAYDAGTFKRKQTADGNHDLKDFFWNDRSCWYFNTLGSQPGCCLYRGEARPYDDLTWKTGENWKYCINIKKGTTLTDVKMYYVDYGYGNAGRYECSKQTHSLKQDLSSIKAYCNSYGCLTRYGWVGSGSFSNKRNC